MKIALFFCLLVFVICCRSVSQVKYDFFISNSGNDRNPGTSKLLPRKTLEGTAQIINNLTSSSGSVKIGLKAGDIFNEDLVPQYPIQFGAYSDLSKNGFAVLNGSDEFNTGWKRVEGTSNTYQQAISYSGFLGVPIGNYSYIFVIEIDKEL